jgi:Domain of unknown function (DUF333)
MKRYSILFFFLLVSPTYAMPNPASVYCSHHGGRLEMMNELSNVTGVCVFHDKSYCEEWSYIRGVCKSKQFYLPKKRIGTKYCLTRLPNKNLIIYLCKA